MNKKIAIPLAVFMSLAIVSAVAVLYFHQTNVDLTVTEARSSADVPFSLTAFSGETKTKDLVIHNSADVPLCASLSFVEDVNEGVTYTNNLPMTITLSPSADTTATVSFSVNEVSEAGMINGTINYQKVVCS